MKNDNQFRFYNQILKGGEFKVHVSNFISLLIYMYVCMEYKIDQIVGGGEEGFPELSLIRVSGWLYRYSVFWNSGVEYIVQVANLFLGHPYIELAMYITCDPRIAPAGRQGLPAGL